MIAITTSSSTNVNARSVNGCRVRRRCRLFVNFPELRTLGIRANMVKFLRFENFRVHPSQLSPAAPNERHETQREHERRRFRDARGTAEAARTSPGRVVPPNRVVSGVDRTIAVAICRCVVCPEGLLPSRVVILVDDAIMVVVAGTETSSWTDESAQLREREILALAWFRRG